MNPYILRNYIFPAYHKIKKTKVIKRINELEENQWLEKKVLERVQTSKLSKLLIHAYETVPFYKKRFDDVGLKVYSSHVIENFEECPILNKETINENLKTLVTTQLNKNRLIPNSTSGSTGESLFFYYDIHSAFYRKAIEIRNQKWLGIKLGEKSARLWGSPIDLNKASSIRGKLHSVVNNILFLSSYDLSEKKLSEYVFKLIRFKPKLLISYPGPLTTLSNYLIKCKKSVPSIQAIICSAETLFDWQKEIIEKAFTSKVYNRYGCREFGDIAQECEKREGLHIHTDRFFLEILKENGERANTGELGKIVITDLDNYGMPLIRYSIEDLGKMQKQVCSCGRTLPLLAEIKGRTLDVIHAPNGNKIGGTFWTLLFRSRPGIKSFQVLQERPDFIIISYIKDKNFRTINFEYFIKKIEEKCGNQLKVHFVEVPSIPVTVSGKTRFVVSKINEAK